MCWMFPVSERSLRHDRVLLRRGTWRRRDVPKSLSVPSFVRPFLRSWVPPWASVWTCRLSIRTFLFPVRVTVREDSLLAMYTFTVGPWLPAAAAAAAISAGLIHKRIRLTHSLRLCLPPRSNKPRRFPPSLGNCGLVLRSACSRCAHTCRRSRWPDGGRRD